MKNSTHAYIWAGLGVPIGIGLMYVIPPIIKDPLYTAGLLLLYFCGYGFLVMSLIEKFEKKEASSTSGEDR